MSASGVPALDARTTTGAGDPQISVAADNANAYADSMPGESTVVLVFDATAALRRKVMHTLTYLRNDADPLVENFRDRTARVTRPAGTGSRPQVQRSVSPA